jgi:DNA repair protein RadC
VNAPRYAITMVRDGSIPYRARGLTCTDRAKEIAIEMIGNEPQEVLIAITLDSQNRVIGVNEISRGTIDKSIVHPREVFRLAILQNASGLIIAHNHPSGELTPSKADITVFESLKAAGNLLGIMVLDSIICNHEKGASMRETL